VTLHWLGHPLSVHLCHSFVRHAMAAVNCIFQYLQVCFWQLSILQLFHYKVTRKVQSDYSCCRDSGWLLSVCTDSSTDTSEPLEHMAQVDRAAWVRARESVHIYGDTRDGARARVVWMHLYIVYDRGSIPGESRPFSLHQRGSPSFLHSKYAYRRGAAATAWR
jgi:hypothetical protein